LESLKWSKWDIPFHELRLLPRVPWRVRRVTSAATSSELFQQLFSHRTIFKLNQLRSIDECSCCLQFDSIHSNGSLDESDEYFCELRTTTDTWRTRILPLYKSTYGSKWRIRVFASYQLHTHSSLQKLFFITHFITFFIL
jgi:hypothetical protein